MKKLLAPLLLVIAAAFLPASFAAEPGWWTDMKRRCRAQGGTISEYYDSYTGCHLPSQSRQSTESHPPGPNLIRKDGNWSPEDGYDWVSADAGDFRVRWVPNKPSKRDPNVVASETEGSWLPADGYTWVNTIRGLGDRRVRWVPNQPSKREPNVVASETEGSWLPADGYTWVNTIRGIGDRRVMWVPNQRSNRHPNVVTTENEGSWRPEDGYKFVNAGSGDLQVVDNGRVEDAIRAAAVVVSLNEQKNRLKELSGLEHYDRVEAALKILATRWVITMPLAGSRAQREILIEHAKGELKDLLKQVLRESVNQMSNDVRKLTPWVWNPFATEKRQLLAKMDREILDLKERAEHEIDGRATFREIRSGSQRSALQYDSGQALRQLLEINNKRRWAN